MKSLTLCGMGLLLALGTPTALAEGKNNGLPVRPGDDVLYMKTNVGSFKILDNGKEKARGHVEISFRGTVLVGDLDGTVTAGPGVRLEYEDKVHHKKVYFGKGKLTVDGFFKAIQFFGKDLTGTYTGSGIIRLTGEFDKNLDTGEFWFKSQPKHRPWGTGSMQTPLPPNPLNPQQNDGGIKGKVKDIGKS